MYARYEGLQIPTNGLPISSALHLFPATDGLHFFYLINRTVIPPRIHVPEQTQNQD